MHCINSFISWRVLQQGHFLQTKEEFINLEYYRHRLNYVQRIAVSTHDLYIELLQQSEKLKNITNYVALVWPCIALYVEF